MDQVELKFQYYDTLQAPVVEPNSCTVGSQEVVAISDAVGR